MSKTSSSRGFRWTAFTASDRNAARRAKRRVAPARIRRLMYEQLENRLVLSGVQLGAAIAWNVADANGNGFGDESNAGGINFPDVPVLISAGIFQSGGPGSNGTVRTQMEWNLSSLTGVTVENAQVLLNTNKGTADSLDTYFFGGTASGNGTLDVSDFETPATQISGAVMPVPNGTDGNFTLDVTTALQYAITNNFSYFVLQGRVNESLDGPAAQRGLQIRSTATGNLSGNLQP